MSQPSLKMQEITVHVIDQDGQAVSGATVGVLTWPHGTVEDATTNDGVAILSIPRGLRLCGIAALKSGAGFDYWPPARQIPELTADDLPDEVHLVLGGARTATVRAVGTDGQPVAGVPVTPWLITVEGDRDVANLLGWSAALVKTDASGAAKFDWLPAGLVGQVPFILHSEEYSLLERPALQAKDPDGAELTMTVYRSGRISGKVTLPDGSGAADILIQIESGGCSSYFRGDGRTGNDGTYSIVAWPQRSYLVGAFDDNWAAESRAGIDVAEGQHRQGIDLVLITGTVISGRYTIGTPGEPVAEQCITLIETEPQPAACREGEGCLSAHLVRWNYTDSDGRYSFRAGPGKFSLEGPGHEEKIDLLVTDQAAIIHDFHCPVPPRGMLNGVVVDQTTGDPVPQAIVRGLSDIRGHREVDARCDGEGEFAQERWNDRMIIWAASADGRLTGMAEICETDTSVRVEAGPAVAAAVKVVDADGNALGREEMTYWMTVHFVDGEKTWFCIESQTDESGLLQMPGLLPGALCAVGVSGRLGDEDNTVTEFVAELTGGETLRLPDIAVPAEEAAAGAG